MSNNEILTKADLKMVLENYPTREELTRFVRSEFEIQEIRIQAQFEFQTEYFTQKIDESHQDLLNRLDFLIEHSKAQKLDALEMQVMSHEQRLAVLEKRLGRSSA